jgi:hypothetical protein
MASKIMKAILLAEIYSKKASEIRGFLRGRHFNISFMVEL